MSSKDVQEQLPLRWLPSPDLTGKNHGSCANIGRRRNKRELGCSHKLAMTTVAVLLCIVQRERQSEAFEGGGINRTSTPELVAAGPRAAAPGDHVLAPAPGPPRRQRRQEPVLLVPADDEVPPASCGTQGQHMAV